MGDLVFNDADKVNLLFKKSVGFASTQSNLQFNNESIKSHNIVFPEHIWSDINTVPLVPPTMSDGDVLNGTLKYYDKMVLQVVAGSGDKAYFNANLKNIMPFSYGDYVNRVQVFTSTNAPLQFGNNGGDWIIDPSAGLLTFHSYDKVNDLVSSTKLPKISFYKYVGTIGIGGSSNTNGQFNALTSGTFNNTNNATIGGDLTVTGEGDFGGDLIVAGNTDLGGDLTVAGNIDLDIIYTSQINYKNTNYRLDFNATEDKLLFDLDSSGIMMKVGNTESFTIQPNGNISMFTNSDEYELNIDGTISATQVLTNSDRRIKTDIKPIDTGYCLDSINKIKMKTFYFKHFWQKNSKSKNKVNIGVIAQELGESFPEFINIRKNDVVVKGGPGEDNIIIDNFHDVDWEQIYKLSIGAIQELSNKLNMAILGKIHISDDIGGLLNCIEKKFIEISEELYISINNKLLVLEDKIQTGNNLREEYIELKRYTLTLENKIQDTQNQLDTTIHKLNNTIEEFNRMKELLENNTKSKGWCEWFFS